MSILCLTVVLEGVEPRVARTLMVPLDLRLDRLHLTLQAAMGWENRHLYEFAAGPLRWGLPHPDYAHDVLPARRTSLQDALAAAGAARLVYTYDFGDNWHHRITAAPTDGPLPGQLYPRLIDAQGRCPPEDVGGTPGYEHFLEAIANPRHPDHEGLLGVGVPPVWWTPPRFRRRWLPWPRHVLPTPLSSAGRWSTWSDPGATPTTWPVSTSRPLSRSATGWRARVAGPAAARRRDRRAPTPAS